MGPHRAGTGYSYSRIADSLYQMESFFSSREKYNAVDGVRGAFCWRGSGNSAFAARQWRQAGYARRIEWWNSSAGRDLYLRIAVQYGRRSRHDGVLAGVRSLSPLAQTQDRQTRALDLFLPRKIVCLWRVFALHGKAPKFGICRRRPPDRQESQINLSRGLL